MSKKQKLFKLILITFTLSLLTGCGYKETLEIYSDGRVRCEMFAYEPTDDVQSKGSVGTETIGGKTYYKFTTTKVKNEELNTTEFEYTYYSKDGTKTNASITGVDCGDKGTTITADTFVWNLQSNTSSVSPDFYTLTVKMPKEIKSTNGKLSADKKTVTFDLTNDKNSSKCYAYTKSKKSNDSITLMGLNSYGHVTKAKTVKVKTSDKIKSIKVNGKSQSSCNIKVKKEGKYKVVVKTVSNSKTFTFYFDKTKPTTSVKGKVYSNSVKITFKDKCSGIKSAKLDGKKIKSGHACSDSGKHTLVLKDKAGNTKKVVFTVE